MTTQEVAIQPNVEVRLHPNTELLEEVVITGYGTGKKLGSVVGSVTKVGGEKLEKTVTANFTDALSGQVSGLSVLSGSGDPSKSATIRLRGVNSLNASTTPLFILDGAPITSTLFNSLNPADIENITVLKDAASTSIYGSRAANGVIVITSKKGKYGQKAEVTLRAQFGFSSMVQDPVEMMNSSQYIQFRDMIGQPVSQEVKDLVSKYGISTNWRDELFDGHAPTYTLDASVNGGGQNTSYYLSVNHHDQQGIMEQSGMRRETIRFNFNSKVNDWLKVGLQSNLGYTTFELNAENEDRSNVYVQNPATFARLALPYDTNREYTFDENGNIIWGGEAKRLHYTGAWTTPSFVNDNRKTTRDYVSGNLNLFEELTPIKGLTIRAQQAMDAYDYTLSHRVYPYDEIITAMGDKISARSGASQQSFSRYYSFTYTNTAEYKFNIKDHYITLLAGQESIISKSRGFGAYSSGHTDKRLMKITQGTKVALTDLSESELQLQQQILF